jgi:hypothetical protein
MRLNDAYFDLIADTSMVRTSLALNFSSVFSSPSPAVEILTINRSHFGTKFSQGLSFLNALTARCLPDRPSMFRANGSVSRSGCCGIRRTEKPAPQRRN